MQAIANEAYKNEPDKKSSIFTSESLPTSVVEAIRTNATGYLKKKFRNLDLLIIDDIQFVAGKKGTGRVIPHLQCLGDQGGQIVLSSDRPRRKLKKWRKD